jgi:hypothetical protein
LKKTRDNLEETVRERTGQLQTTVTALKNEMQDCRSELENQLRQWSRVFMDAADPIVIEDMTGIIVRCLMHPYFQKKTTNKLFFAIPFQISRATVVAGLVVAAQTGVLGPLGSLLANIVLRYGRTRLFFNSIGFFFFFIV